ncbi:excisionase family DNA-binding protein [Rhodococcus sp. BP-316]|uniref:helix-turn-helix transcriptional regulator n=1 Tax=Rhodococcus sp. BP-316 TaxID=2739445 RepID=UPI001C9A4717|nr:excisionase family DNA-binding protein [Rhodococcus sp. BP-316]MBY6679933.1 excisionase family DNA-binding protein [Rhodococcus sp. BP-316]
MAITATTRRLVSITEAAAYLNTSTATVSRRLADGTLTRHRIGPRTVRVDLDEVDRVFGLSS